LRGGAAKKDRSGSGPIGDKTPSEKPRGEIWEGIKNRTWGQIGWDASVRRGGKRRRGAENKKKGGKFRTSTLRKGEGGQQNRTGGGARKKGGTKRGIRGH